jgi:hypothetical protein
MALWRNILERDALRELRKQNSLHESLYRVGRRDHATPGPGDDSPAMLTLSRHHVHWQGHTTHLQRNQYEWNHWARGQNEKAHVVLEARRLGLAKSVCLGVGVVRQYGWGNSYDCIGVLATV